MEKINNIQLLLKQGFEFLNAGNNSDALVVAQKVLKIRFNIDSLVLAGISLFNERKFEQSEVYLQKAFLEKKHDETIQIYYIECLTYQGKFLKGIEVIRIIKNKSYSVIRLLIKLFEANGNFTNAIGELVRLENDIYKFETLAWNFEKTNNIKQAKKNASKGLKIDIGNYKCNIVLTKIFIRNNKYKKGKKQLKQIILNELSNTNLSIYYSQKAQIYEKQRKYEKAFNTFKKSNDFVIKTDAYKKLSGNSYYTHKIIQNINSYFGTNKPFKNLLLSDEKIIFMVGYPRSGTTLLENILNSHSKVSTIEEKPTIDNILKYFLKTPESIKKLGTIKNDEIKILQDDYLKRREKYCKVPRKYIIDKLPLNIIHIGILYRIFPNAKFIISKRDVRDVAISCFFQNFAISDAMSHFLDWNTTKKYLDEIMNLGLSIVENLSINHKIVVYEELVEKPFKVVKDIICYLGLEWEDSMKKYRSNIIGKNINTPSYYAISKKINTNKKNNWKNYKQYF